MEHAHPLPDGSYTPSRQSSQIPSTSSVALSSPKIANLSPRSYEILNPQSRILQLRNTGFRGPIIPGRRVSPIFGPALHEPGLRPINNENSPRPSDRRILYGEDLPPSPVNILQEIQNSTRRRQISPKAGLGAIFEDKTSELVAQEAGGVSWYNDESKNCSPSPSNSGPVKMMKLRERTLNELTPPPLSSPLAKQVKSRKMNRVNLRSTSFEASKYIEHLESQLAAVNAKLDSLMSPATNRARSAKLRALTTEVRSLRLDLADWERKFEERVEEEIHGRAEYETGMRSRIQSLEDEMEIKDSRMRELEWEIDGMRTKVAEAEGLEEINLNLERRIDVLSSLVAQSPTKVNLYSASPSPNTTDPMKQTPRPKPMLPRLPSSSGGVRLSLNTKVEAAFWDPKRFASTSAISVSPGGASNSIEEEDDDDETSLEPMSRGLLARPSSCTNASFRSLPSFSTRPTSTASITGLTSPEMPFPADFDSQTRSANRQRRMRRFPSGSCTIKPLILPNAAVTPSLPASAPLYTDSDVRRDISSTSLDPTIAFLSKNDENSPICTPTQPACKPSAPWALEDTPNARGESSQQLAKSQEEYLNQFVLPNDALDTPCEVSTEHHKPKRARPLSLDKELELTGFLSPNQFEDGLIAADVEEATRFEPTPTGLEPPPYSEDLLPNTDLRRRIFKPSSTPKLLGRQGAFMTPPKTAFSTVIAHENASGIFARLTSLIFHANQDPVVIAKRLLCNAWNLSATRFSGIRWWLLGLVFRSHGPGRVYAADRKTVEEHSSNIFNWQYLSAQASRRRTAEHSLRNRGEIVHADSHELAFRGVSNTRGNSNPTFLSRSDIRPSSLSRIQPHLFPCDECVEPSSHRSFRLWINFSLAMILAVGVAIKHGPGALLMDQNSHMFHTYHQPLESKSCHEQLSSTCSSQSTKVGSPRKASGDVDPESGGSGGEEIVFAEILGPGDFQNLA